ncbi:hypothetical protein HS088_TW23G00176 [Tripterygium wilfordii]|uniref:Uncharacterized protein n=1 Tax=Tripterygium wilfordii TaxID=458696 RepID=A0A7J7BU96_TRIWF|nr:hypothetical protein HS088_TW23G00176 [Tripterygium wilfordii]
MESYPRLNWIKEVTCHIHQGLIRHDPYLTRFNDTIGEVIEDIQKLTAKLEGLKEANCLVKWVLNPHFVRIPPSPLNQISRLPWSPRNC